jgi:predicted secreted hydrolase
MTRVGILLALLISQTALAAGAVMFQQALPGYVYQFPRDHGNHPRFKTEWWYTTGHLTTDKSQQPFGFELTFFRSATGATQQDKLPKNWQISQVYPAHFAITDVASQRFFYTQRMNRPAFNQAGAQVGQLKVWNENWQLTQTDPQHWQLLASHPPYKLQLTLTPQKPPAIHGVSGVSQKADCKGCASHYYSMTRLKAQGQLTHPGADGKAATQAVTGLVWMDHEFGSNQLTPNQVGWDWFSIQLADGSDWMFYQMRLKNGQTDPNSSGSAVTQQPPIHLTQNQFEIKPLTTWVSPHWPHKPRYPAQWRIRVPSQQLVLTITPVLADQELAFTNQLAYWEGACRVSGTRAGKPVSGQAYVELTGYAQAFRQKI